jgi:hypothetical protein
VLANLETDQALDVKIVGVRYYDGYATSGEVVVCSREPQNPVSLPGSLMLLVASFVSVGVWSF